MSDKGTCEVTKGTKGDGTILSPTLTPRNRQTGDKIVPSPFVLSLPSASPQETEALGEYLGALLQPGDVLLLSGDLGAGKTQLTKGIARALGVEEPITSPTFNILLEHETAQGVPLRHFDLYRLEDEEELVDIDYFGLLEDESISVVEWGDKFADALPLDYLGISFELQANDERTLQLIASGPRGEKLLSNIDRLIAESHANTTEDLTNAS